MGFRNPRNVWSFVLKCMTSQEIHGSRNNNGLLWGSETPKDFYPLLKSLPEKISKGVFSSSEGKTHNLQTGLLGSQALSETDLVFAQGRHVWLNHGMMLKLCWLKKEVTGGSQVLCYISLKMVFIIVGRVLKTARPPCCISSWLKWILVVLWWCEHECAHSVHRNTEVSMHRHTHAHTHMHTRTHLRSTRTHTLSLTLGYCLQHCCYCLSTKRPDTAVASSLLNVTHCSGGYCWRAAHKLS